MNSAVLSNEAETLKGIAGADAGAAAPVPPVDAPAQEDLRDGTLAGSVRAKAPRDKAGPARAAPAKPVRPQFKPDRSFNTVVIGTTVGVLAAFAIGRSGWFTPGDDIGYYVGMVGGILMLLLLLYPLRKHVAAFRTWGKVKGWFAVHMVLGISGPILVLAHSTFHMHSTNASVALICMLVVAGSGIVGRFFYTKVHRGLYGEKATLEELQSEAGLESDEVRSRLHFAPAVEKQLAEFREFALAKRSGFGAEAARFLSLGWRRWQVQRACDRELRATLRAVADERSWDADKFKRRLHAAQELVTAYLGLTQRVADFSVYDRLLQLWHVAHVPLVYLLVISGIAHVVAVHMY